MKKVLIILYYWPPSGGMAVQRWLKFSKYLPEFGWMPVIYAPENASYPEYDPTLEKDIRPDIEVIRRPILEPHHLYQRFVGIRKESGIGVSMSLREKPSRLAQMKNILSMWFRGNLFIPDARVLWVRPSARFLKKHLETNPVDAIITTGTPHSLHLIGRRLRKHFEVPWIADFRDLWTGIDYYADLKLTWCADRYHHHLERKVLQQADQVITVGEIWKQEFLRIGAKAVTVITNGYDTDDIPSGKPAPDEKFTIVHVGSIGRNRNAEALWRALSAMAARDGQFKRDLRLKLIGGIDFSVLESISFHGLAENLNRIEYLSQHDALKAEQRARLLLLIVNNSADAPGRLTGKIFEYMASKRPILVIGPEDGEAAGMVETTKSGFAAGFEDVSKIEQIVGKFYNEYRKGTFKDNSSEPAQFTRKNLTGRLAELLDQLTRKG